MYLRRFLILYLLLPVPVPVLSEAAQTLDIAYLLAGNNSLSVLFSFWFVLLLICC